MAFKNYPPAERALMIASVAIAAFAILFLPFAVYALAALD